MLDNVTLQETLGALLAFLIFPLVLVVPGYVLGWILNLLDFRNRLLFIRFLIAIVLSNAICPVFIYLACTFVSVNFALVILFGCLVVFALIVFTSRKQSNPWGPPRIKRYQIIALILGAVWGMFSILWLVDIQIGHSLYFNAVAYDYTTRVAMVNAMTRTGIPPINPGYYPGHPEKLEFLYFFWYMLASIVDTLGGKLVSAQAAMIASVSWCGLCLMATIALYLRLRYKAGGGKVWRLSIFAAQLLLVSGLDFIPIMILLVRAKMTLGHLIFDARIEGWNTVAIMDWFGALMWVPLHVASLAACLAGLILFLYMRTNEKKQALATATISGIAFASALGLSVWVTFGFAIFWGLWMVALFFQKQRETLPYMALSGIIALALAFPFISGVLHSQAGASSGGMPLELYVRPFPLLNVYSETLSPFLQNIINILLLPVNYFFELGFFLVVGLLWVERNQKTAWRDNPYRVAEVVLLSTIAVSLSFFRSTAEALNDFGVRVWLLGQFVLLIWAVDLLENTIQWKSLSLFSVFGTKGRRARANRILAIFMALGVITTILDMAVIRTWPILVDMNIVGFPNELSPDTQLGSRTYAARLAYEYIDENVPENAIVQENPAIVLNRPAGLYGSRQVAIADRTAYGVPIEQFKSLAKEIGQIFLLKNVASWDGIDRICSQHFINIIIVNDVDPLWSSLGTLSQARPPLYKNQYYAVFSCG